MASFPTSVKTWTALVDASDYPEATDLNTVYDEVTAIETGYLTGTAPLNSSASTVASLSVSGKSTFAGDIACTGTIGTSAARVKTLWVGQLEASSGTGVSSNSSAIVATLNVDSSGGIHLSTGTPTAVTNTLYNVDGALYFNGSLVGASVNKIQHGTVTIASGSTSGTSTVVSVNSSKAFISFGGFGHNGAAALNNYKPTQIFPRLSFASTLVTARIVDDASATITVAFDLIEYT